MRGVPSSGALKTAARELAKSSLELVGVQTVKWDTAGTKRAVDYALYVEKK
jgi:hypothetical protein